MKPRCYKHLNLLQSGWIHNENSQFVQLTSTEQRSLPIKIRRTYQEKKKIQKQCCDIHEKKKTILKLYIIMGVSSVDRKLLPGCRCPASSGSVCSGLQTKTETFLCSCSLHDCNTRDTHTHIHTHDYVLALFKPLGCRQNLIYGVKAHDLLTLPFLHVACGSGLECHHLYLDSGE